MIKVTYISAQLFSGWKTIPYWSNSQSLQVKVCKASGIRDNSSLYKTNCCIATWEDVLGGGCKKTLQLVLPHKLVSAVLLQLHDARTAGHLGGDEDIKENSTEILLVGT